MDDRELVERARRGDLDAFDALARAYQGVAFHAAYFLTRDAAEAEDALQEGFIRAYAALSSFRPGAPFRPWLLRIVTNAALNRRRASRRWAALGLRAEGRGLRGDATPPPEHDVLARELRASVVDAVERLDEAYRLVVVYRYFLDLSVAEIAEILDCPPSTVRTRLSRALARLRVQLTDPATKEAARE